MKDADQVDLVWTVSKNANVTTERSATQSAGSAAVPVVGWVQLVNRKILV